MMAHARIYRVQTRGFGELLKTADDITSARKWAARAFPVEACAVSRFVEPRQRCQCCDSRPCVCSRRT